MENAIKNALLGHCVVYPTSTLPALGCILTSEALDRLYDLKKRTSDMVVSIGVCNLEQAAELVYLTEDLEDFLSSFPEGSVTIILQAKKTLPFSILRLSSLIPVMEMGGAISISANNSLRFIFTFEGIL